MKLELNKKPKSLQTKKIQNQNENKILQVENETRIKL